VFSGTRLDSACIGTMRKLLVAMKPTNRARADVLRAGKTKAASSTATNGTVLAHAA
jgi:hypothetical protein